MAITANYAHKCTKGAYTQEVPFDLFVAESWSDISGSGCLAVPLVRFPPLNVSV